MPYSQGYGPPLIDFGQMSNVVQQFQQGQEYGRQRNLRNEMNGLDPSSPDYFDQATATLQKYDPLAALKLRVDRDAANALADYRSYAAMPDSLKMLQAIQGGATDPSAAPGVGAGVPQPQSPEQPSSPYAGMPAAVQEDLMPLEDQERLKVSAKEEAESASKARINLPIVENATRRILSTIEGIEKSPGLPRATGPIQSRLPTVTGDVADVEAKIEQATSGGFLQMYDQIRGAGQITEAEGAKASGALFRLAQLGQSDSGYLQALKEAKFEVFELMNVTRRKAGLPPLPNPYATQETGGSGEGWTDLGNGIRIRQKQ